MQTFFLTAAHTTPYLPELVEELRAIEKALRPLKERGLWQILSNRAANINDVFETFSHEQSDIRVFHYSGHADQQELSLEDGGHIRGIASLFGLAEPEAQGGNPLYFVFLNGCASQGQVAQLHAVGVGAVIATRRPIQDKAARHLAERFYQTWAMEGKTLEQAFQTAKAFVQSDPAEQQHSIEERGSLVLSEDEEEEDLDFDWGLYLHPAGGRRILDWVINPVAQLPPQLLRDVRTRASENLLELVDEFEQNEAEAKAEIESGTDPVLVLITRLPWTIGTHLRRLFVWDESKSMAEPGLERLRELVSAYTELTRFISYISLSALWDERQRALVTQEQLATLPLIPDSTERSIDYIWRLRQYFALQREIPGDSFGVETHLERFLQTIDAGLSEAYPFLEELKSALIEEEEHPQRLEELIYLRSGNTNGINEICLQTETLFTHFLRASLWLTKFRLYTVRSILVDKIRYLEMKSPYVHRTMFLHGAFSEIKLLSTKREVASDNSCILLAPLQPAGADPLANALNLSPFYIDKSAYIEDKITHYPTVYVLKYRENETYVYEYLDGDINHEYLFAEDHRLIIRKVGAIFPAALKIDIQDSRKFQVIHRQLVKLEEDFTAV